MQIRNSLSSSWSKLLDGKLTNVSGEEGITTHQNSVSRSIFRQSLILAVLVCLGIGLIGVATEYQWNFETVGEGAGHLSMTRAADGTLHACFQLDDPCCSPGYAYRDENGWSDVERVDPENLGGDYVKIALNSAGYPVIAYQKESHLWIAVRSAAGWTTELVDARFNAGSYLDLAIDASGQYHIAYAIDKGLYYALFDGSSWTFEELRTSGEAYKTCGIAIDSNGYPHVSYWARLSDGEALGYGFEDESGWHFETVDTPKRDLGAYSTIALDASDNPHICYRDHPADNMKYATKNAGVWTVEVVNTSGDAGILSSIRVAPDGIPCVAYRDAAHEELRYAKRIGGIWISEVVSLLSSSSVSLQFDNEGMPQILYVLDGEIRLAYEGDSTMMPPIPNPTTWSVLPHAVSDVAIEMVASTSTDLDGVEYYFDEVTGNPGGSDSGWQDSSAYTDTGLSSGTEYCYRVRARDKSPNHNVTDWSVLSCESAILNDVPPPIDWVSFLPFDNPENYVTPWPRLEDLVLDASGNAYAVGEVCWNDPSLGWPGITLVGKWSPSGQLLWDNIYDLPDNRQHPRAAVIDNQGNLFVTGVQFTGAAPNWFILRIDQSGALQETWRSESSGYKCFWSIDAHPSGDLFLCANYGYYDAWVGRFDWKTATWVWSHVYNIDPDTKYVFDVGVVGALDPDGSVYYFGKNISLGGTQETLIAKLAADDGTLLALISFDFSPGYSEMPTAFEVDGEGNLVGLAWHVGDNRGTVFKLDSDLNLIWAQTIQGLEPYLFLRELDVGPDGTIYVVGRDGEKQGWNENSENSHMFTCAFGSDGELLWMHVYDAGGPDEREWGSGNGIACTVDGSRVVAGGTVSFSETNWTSSYAILSYGKTVVNSSAVFRLEAATGDVQADGPFYGASFQSGAADVAEWVPVSEPVDPGDVLEFDPDNPGQYRKSRGQCSDLVAGVVSTDPGFVLGSSPATEDSGLSTPDSALLALVGIVPVKVTDEGGPIEPGDLLVSSSTPGYAMRQSLNADYSCNLVGKALELMLGERGMILVLLTAH